MAGYYMSIYLNGNHHRDDQVRVLGYLVNVRFSKYILPYKDDNVGFE